MLRAPYWALAVLLVGFGVLALASIGMPFLAVGVTLAALGPWRGRPAVFWPWLVAVLAFFGGYLLVAPLACTARETAPPPDASGAAAVEVAGGDVTCTTLLGILDGGGHGAEPPRWPAALVGTATALVAGGATRAVLARRSGPPAGPSGRARRASRR